MKGKEQMKYKLKDNLTLPDGSLALAGEESDLKGVTSSRVKTLIAQGKIEEIKSKEPTKGKD